MQNIPRWKKSDRGSSHFRHGLDPRLSAVEAECDTQTLPMDIQTIEVGDEIQVATMPSSTTRTIHRSKYTQTTAFKPTTRSVKTQTLIDATSSFFREVKQSLPASESSPENSGSIIAQTSRIQKEVEIYETSSASEEAVEEDFQYSPSEATSTESEDTSEEVDSKTQTVLRQGKPLQEQIKFVVFEDAVLEAFGLCRLCGSNCAVTMESQRGSLCKISSCCTRDSKHNFEWMTAPTVNGMPVFHLLLASGVLATGMESSKALRLSQT